MKNSHLHPAIQNKLDDKNWSNKISESVIQSQVANVYTEDFSESIGRKSSTRESGFGRIKFAIAGVLLVGFGLFVYRSVGNWDGDFPGKEELITVYTLGIFSAFDNSSNRKDSDATPGNVEFRIQNSQSNSANTTSYSLKSIDTTMEGDLLWEEDWEEDMILTSFYLTIPKNQ